MSATRRRMMDSGSKVAPDGRILDSWAKIISNINAGRAQKCYQPGFYKELTRSTGETLRMVLCGFDKETLASGGKAKTRWSSYEVMSEDHRTSKYLSANFDVSETLPEPVKSNVKTIVHKYQIYEGDGNGTWPSSYKTGNFKTWMPTKEDVSDLYNSSNKVWPKAKCKPGSTTKVEWFTASYDLWTPHYNAAFRMYVKTNGALSTMNDNVNKLSAPVPLCFCI